MVEYTPRHVKIKKENIAKMNEIKESSGRSQQWIINKALDYLFENEWDNLMR